MHTLRVIELCLFSITITHNDHFISTILSSLLTNFTKFPLCIMLHPCVFLIYYLPQEWSREKKYSTTDNRNDATTATIAAVPRILPKFCDIQTKFIENCNPQPTNCTETINTHSVRGIGNALMVRYSEDDKPVFEKNCRPIIRDGTPFKLLNYVRVPEYAVSVQSKKRTIHALTQPLPNVQTKIDQILRPDQQHLPLIAVHVRTGWADELVRRRDVWDKFSTSVCSHNDVAQYVSDPLGHAIYDTNFPEFNLDGMLDQVSEKANAKYGRQQWRFFVASDAPAVKQYAMDYLKGNYVGDEALTTHGLVSHNVGVRYGQIPNSAVRSTNINNICCCFVVVLAFCCHFVIILLLFCHFVVVVLLLCCCFICFMSFCCCFVFVLSFCFVCFMSFCCCFVVVLCHFVIVLLLFCCCFVCLSHFVIVLCHFVVVLLLLLLFCLRSSLSYPKRSMLF